MNKVTKKINKDSMESRNNGNNHTICICLAPNYYKRTSEKDLTRKSRKYGKDSFITIIQNKGKIDSTGENIYFIGTFKAINWWYVRGEKDSQEILDWLKSFENNQTIDCTNSEIIENIQQTTTKD